MSDLTRREDRSPIPGWKIDSSGRDSIIASTRWHYSWVGFYAFAAVWNFVFPRLPLPSTRPEPPHFILIGEIAALVFVILAARAYFARTAIRFSAKELVIENPLAPWQRYRVDLVEIRDFEAIAHPDQRHTDVGVRLTSGVLKPLPIDWQPLPVSFKHLKKRLFVAPAGDASWMATALTEMLAKARLLGHDTYRS